MKGKCALFHLEVELRRSHVIPKFAYDYMKESGTKYMRTLTKPNQRQQDGHKEYLLGDKAEGEFSKRENWFASNIFLPYLKDGKTSISYDERLAYFSISLLWRVLVTEIKKNQGKFEPNQMKLLDDLAEEWRKFLADGIFPNNFSDVNLLLTDRVKSHTTDLVNVDLYMTRATDATIIGTEQGEVLGVYAKFSRFIFWSEITPDSKSPKQVKIDFIGGKLGVSQDFRNDLITSFLQSRIAAIDSMDYPSEKQQEIIMGEMLKDEKYFWESDAGKSMANDFRLGRAN